MAQLPITELKPAVLSVVRILNAGATAASDGIQVFPDLISMLPSLMSLPAIVEKKDVIFAQALDLDSAEIDDIAASVEAEMGFGSAKAKNVTEKALKALAHNLNVILAIRDPETDTPS